MNLDGEHSTGVRNFLCDNVAYWIQGFHIDALRLDAVDALVDRSPTHLLAELTQRMGQIRTSAGCPVTLIAESDRNQVRLLAQVTPQAAAGSAALLLLGPFTPLLFQGQEWGATTCFRYFTDHDEDLGRAVCHGRERDLTDYYGHSTERWGEPMPDPQALETFRASILDWDEISYPEHAAMLDWYRRLIALRRHQPERTRAVARSGDDWVEMTNGRYRVVLTLSSTRTYPLRDAVAHWGSPVNLPEGPGIVGVGVVVYQLAVER